MSDFANAFIANSKNDSIPTEYNFYERLIGNWDIVWVENEGSENERRVKGEWLFSWVLEGMAIQDLFIVPSRVERKINPQPDGEYGTTIRFYNPNTNKWDIYYGCTGYAFRLEGRKEGESIVHTEIFEGKMKWIISDITEDSFKWEKLMCNEEGIWNIEGIVYAKRKQ